MAWSTSKGPGISPRGRFRSEDGGTVYYFTGAYWGRVSSQVSSSSREQTTVSPKGVGRERECVCVPSWLDVCYTIMDGGGVASQISPPLQVDAPAPLALSSLFNLSLSFCPANMRSSQQPHQTKDRPYPDCRRYLGSSGRLDRCWHIRLGTRRPLRVCCL